MSMRIDVRERAGVVIFDVNGRIVHGEGPAELCDAVKRLLDQGQKGRRLLLNVAGVPKADSTGLGAMVACYTSATSGSFIKPQ